MLVALIGSPAFCTAAMARRTQDSVKGRDFVTAGFYFLE
jgi:hypothetical protein